MTDARFRYLKPQGLIAFITLLAIGIYLANKFLSTRAEFTISILGIIMGMLLVVDQYLWKYPPFKWLYWIPNVSGRYEGVINYKNPFTQAPDRKQCILEVFQTGSKLKVKCYFQHEHMHEPSESKSLVESIIKNEDDTFSLVFTYQNEGIQSEGQSHYGTNILKFINNKNGKFLKGYYYTNREPQTKGVMEVKHQSDKLKNDF